MKMKKRIPGHFKQGRRVVWALPIAASGLIAGCAEQQPGSSVDVSAPAQAAAQPSLSAAALSNDGVNSVSFAQAVAAGLIENPEPLANEQTDSETGATVSPDSASEENVNPLALIPTTNSIESAVVGDSDPLILPNPTTTSTTVEAIVNSPSTGQQSASTSPLEVVEPDLLQSQPESTTNDSVSESNGSEPQTEETQPITQQVSTAPESGENEGSSTEQFSSSTTEGFNGEVLADALRISWEADPAARGYNVYKQAQYITTVFDTEYIDEDVYDSDYYYEIQAFNFSDELYYIATGLTVSPRTLGRTDPNEPLPNADILEDYELVFSDEFNGSQLDTTKWNTSYLWGTDLIINSEEQYYVDIANEPDFGFNPFSFDGNNLTINSVKTPPELSSKALNQPYLSGVITSYDAFKFTYGYIETRAKVSFGRGYWPAFWLLNAYYVDDKPEIDIMEFIGQDQDVVYHTYHYYDSAGQLRSTKSQPTPGIDYTSDFHTYAAEWKPGTIIFYIDGIERHRINDPKVSRQDMYVIANTALGGWWAGSPDDSTPFPGEYTLDYIRVYQKTTPYNDDVFLNDGITAVPYADDIPEARSPNHRPSKEDWPEGYPDGL
ncbi:MAG: family 16 glycosylhydrolase [Granulosicoccus sp.]